MNSGQPDRIRLNSSQPSKENSFFYRTANDLYSKNKKEPTIFSNDFQGVSKPWVNNESLETELQVINKKDKGKNIQSAIDILLDKK